MCWWMQGLTPLHLVVDASPAHDDQHMLAAATSEALGGQPPP